MINIENLVQLLKEHKIHFYTGIPDSVLKEFCYYLSENMTSSEHMIPANEGNAVALAAGHYLATGEIPLCYMQNSGLGNALNPMLSLTDELVYRIPILYMIGYRGKDGEKDEPQHKKQGLVTEKLLSLLEIEYLIIRKETSLDELDKEMLLAIERMKRNKTSFALLVEKGSFEEYKEGKLSLHEEYELTEEEAIADILNVVENSIVVSSTGYISRFLFELREIGKQGHKRDFLNIGAMGHSSMLAVGIAKNLVGKKVFILDGDGAALMHMGTFTVIGGSGLDNIVHIVLNNSSHNSVGGMPTKGFDISFTAIASASGYTNCFFVTDRKGLGEVLVESRGIKGRIFIEIRINKGVRKDLSRPNRKPEEMKDLLMKYLEEEMR